MPVGSAGDERRSSCVGLKACTARPSNWFLCFHWLFQLVSVYLPGFEVSIGTDAGIPGLKSPGYSDYLSSTYLDLVHSQKRFLSMLVTWCLIAFCLLSWQFKYYFWDFVSCISYVCFWFFEPAGWNARLAVVQQMKPFLMPFLMQKHLYLLVPTWVIAVFPGIAVI